MSKFNVNNLFTPASDPNEVESLSKLSTHTGNIAWEFTFFKMKRSASVAKHTGVLLKYFDKSQKKHTICVDWHADSKVHIKPVKKAVFKLDVEDMVVAGVFFTSVSNLDSILINVKQNLRNAYSVISENCRKFCDELLNIIEKNGGEYFKEAKEWIGRIRRNDVLVGTGTVTLSALTLGVIATSVAVGAYFASTQVKKYSNNNNNNNNNINNNIL